MRVLAEPFFAINLGDANPGSRSTPLPPNIDYKRAARHWGSGILPTQKKQSLTGRPQAHILSAADFVSGSGFGGDGCSKLGRNSSR
jgi:hypothetical protein